MTRDLELRRRFAKGGSLSAIALLVASPALAATSQVGVQNSFFSPATVTIYAGDSVQWTNFGGFHNAAADSGLFRCAQGCDSTGGDGDASSAAWVASFPFFSPATVPYYCEIHGGIGGGMNGTVIVQRSIFDDGFESGFDDEWVADTFGGDHCASPLQPVLPANDLPGHLRGAMNHLDLTLDSSCLTASARGRDRLYQVVVPSGQTLTATVTPTSPGFDPAIYLIAAASCADEPLSCLDGANAGGAGAAESVLFQSALVDPTSVLIVIDTVSSATAGSDYTLDITVQ